MSTFNKSPSHLRKFNLTENQASMTKTTKMPNLARIFLKMLTKLQHGHLRIVTPDQTLLSFGNVEIDITAILYIHDWRACARILRGGDIGFAQAYEAGWISTNNLTALLRLAIVNENVLNDAIFGGKVMGLWHKLKHWLRPNTRQGSKKNIHAHYDIGNSFYELWLDKSWTYSSAVFHGDYAISLEQAQANKYQRIIDTLQLKSGDKVLEVGCGWGGFAQHAAERGIHVHGITISAAQLEVAQKRIHQKNLQQLAKLELCDYRDLDQQYDAIVSIEMFEAVGEQYWDIYFEKIAQCLKPNGKALIQTITIDEKRFEKYRSGTDFIQQYIFPGGMLPSPVRFSDRAAKQGLQTIESYSFGKDYAETLRRWNVDFEHHQTEIAKLGFDVQFQRIWQLYFSYCEAGFEEGNTDVIQFMLQKNA